MMKSGFPRGSLPFRIAVLFIALVILPYILLAAVAYIGFQRHSISSLGDTTMDTMAAASANIASMMQDCESETMSLYYTGCVELLRPGHEVPENERGRIESALNSCCNSNAALYAAYLVTDTETFHGGRRYPELLDIMEPYREEIESAGGRCMWYPTNRVHGKAGEYRYVLARSLNSQIRKNVGVLYVLMDSRLIEQTFSQLTSEKAVRYLTDANGLILYSSDPQTVNTVLDISAIAPTDLQSYQVIRDRQDQKIILSANRLLSSGWYCISIINVRSVQSDILRLVVPFLLISIVYIGFLLFMLYVLKKYMFQPLQLLKNSMDQYAQGELEETNIEIAGVGEFRSLSEHFNSMTCRINRLMQAYQAQTEEKNRQRMNALAAQLSPHFLYNALNTIKWVAVLNRQESIQHLVESLVAILMNAIRPEDRDYTLRDELALVEHYAVLQKTRFMNFELVLEIDEGCLDCKLRKLLLQPIVENAIVHGLNRGKVREGVITIKAWISNALYITVSDQGVGFDVEKWRRFPPESKDHTNIGIHNVEEILRLEYGAPYGLQIDSAPGNGTTVTFMLPVCRKERENDSDDHCG